MRRLCLLVLVAGCKQIFGLSEPAPSDARADAAIPDAATCMTQSAECLGDVLRTCSGPGVFPVDTTCSWGCDGNAPHCLQLMPAGGGVTTQDVASDATLAAVTLSAPTVVIDGDTGSIGTAAQPDLVRPAGTGTKNGIEYHVTNNVAVFRFASLSVSAPTTPIGAHAVALVAAGDITVSADIDAQAPCRGQGALGGYAGGDPGAAGNGPGAGMGGSSNSTAGCGAGHGGPGGRGGRNVAGGPVYGDAAITMLVGGSGGGGGGSSTSGGHGGAGGGALELVSGTSISIAAGINAGACGGTASASGNQGGGGGGGAGGTLLFEAPHVTIPGVLAVNGGGGGAPLGGTNGADGSLDRTAAPGGTGNATGGAGAAGAVITGEDGMTNGPPAAGGGGGIGRIRVNTRDGMATLNGQYSPAPGDSQTTFTVGTAALQ